MSSAQIPPNEQERLESLQSYHILDTATEQDFDKLTELASVELQLPLSAWLIKTASGLNL